MSNIKAFVEGDNDLLKADLSALDFAAFIIQDAGFTVLNTIQPDALQEMKTYPRPAVHPFGFGTPKSKGYYFAAIHGKIPGVTIPTDGKRYKRTGGLADSMFFEGQDIDIGYEFKAGSNFSKAHFVVGDFEGQGARQVKGHRTTQWPKLFSTVERHFDEIELQMDAAINDSHTSFVRERLNT